VWANLAQPNHLADYLALGTISAGFLWAVGRLRLAYLLPAEGVIVYIMALTGSRMPWLYLGTAAVIATVFWLADRSQVNRRLTLFSLGSVIGLLVVPLAVDALAPLLDEAARVAIQRMRGQLSFPEERPLMWQVAWEVFERAPVLGVGFRQIAEHYFFLPAALSPPRSVGFTDHAHNIVLQVMAEFGLVGALVLLAGGLSWVVGWWGQPRTPAMWWLIGLTAVLAIHSMLEYPLWYAFFLGIAAVLLGLGDARTVEFHSARCSAFPLAIAGALLLGWVAFAQMFIDYLVLESFLAFRYRYIHATAEASKRARETLLEVGRTSLLTPWVELGLARSMEVDRDRLADKLAINGRAMRAFPIEDVVYRQAMLLALSGMDGPAREQWDRAVVIFPTVRAEALLVLRRRVEGGLDELAPLLEHAERQTKERP
jgi:hypothetical protein